MSTRWGIILSACLSATPLAADEAWQGHDGAIYWDSDVGHTAIFKADTIDGPIAIYLPDLGLRIEERGTHYGYWLGDDAEYKPCDAALVGADDTSSRNWGQIILTFDKGQFPTGWTAHMSVCFGTPSIPLRANLIDG